MKTYDKEKILHKWDGVPEPEDAYAETRISGARIACGLLEKVVGWPDDIKRKMGGSGDAQGSAVYVFDLAYLFFCFFLNLYHFFNSGSVYFSFRCERKW
jgi:hypothetical protein